MHVSFTMLPKNYFKNSKKLIQWHRILCMAEKHKCRISKDDELKVANTKFYSPRNDISAQY